MNKPVVVFSLTTPISIQLLGNRLHLLVAAGVDLHVLVGEQVVNQIPELPCEATLHVIPLKRGIDPFNDAVALIRTIRLLRKLRPRLVAAATPKASLITLLAAAIIGVPVRVWEVWGAKWDGPPTKKTDILVPLDRFVAKTVTTVVAVSPSLAQLLQERQIVPTKPQVVGHGSTKGVDTEIYRPSLDKGLRQRPTLGFVGRLSQDKGIDEVLLVAESIRSQFPNLKLLLVGEIDTTNPPSTDTIKTMAGSSWIQKTGWVKDTSVFYREIDVLLFPSQREGLPNALLEAAACGVPSVSYAVTGCKDAVEHGATGYTVPIPKKSELVNRVLQLLSQPSLAYSLGQSARRKMEREFEASAVQALWHDFYLKHLGRATD